MICGRDYEPAHMRVRIPFQQPTRYRDLSGIILRTKRTIGPGYGPAQKIWPALSTRSAALACAAGNSPPPNRAGIGGGMAPPLLSPDVPPSRNGKGPLTP